MAVAMGNDGAGAVDARFPEKARQIGPEPCAALGVQERRDGDVHRAGNVAIARGCALKSRIFWGASGVPKAVRARRQSGFHALPGGPGLGIGEGA